MYNDHQFCSEDCRDAQIQVDMKVEKVHENLEASHCVRRLQALALEKRFEDATVISHDGTEYMRQIGVKSILVQLDESKKREDLVGMVLAGFVQWTHPKKDSARSSSSSSEGQITSKLSFVTSDSTTSSATNVQSICQATTVTESSESSQSLDTTPTRKGRSESEDKRSEANEKSICKQDVISKGTSELETHACLMCFKTSTALEVMLCDVTIYIPEEVENVKISPMLSLRKKSNFKAKSNLKRQLGYDMTAAKYLTANCRTPSSAGELNTCQVCSIM